MRFSNPKREKQFTGGAQTYAVAARPPGARRPPPAGAWLIVWQPLPAAASSGTGRGVAQRRGSAGLPLPLPVPLTLPLPVLTLPLTLLTLPLLTLALALVALWLWLWLWLAVAVRGWGWRCRRELGGRCVAVVAVVWQLCGRCKQVAVWQCGSVTGTHKCQLWQFGRYKRVAVVAGTSKWQLWQCGSLFGILTRQRQ
jgi:hypothetical protein